MTELAASPHYRAYLDSLLAGLKREMEIAVDAKKIGIDPRVEVEIPIASDLAGRVETLLGYKGVAECIRQLETKMSREEASLHIADHFADHEFGETTREEILEHTIRASMALITEGVVAAPTEGVGKIAIKKNDDGTEYLSIYYAGPIRSAGGTAQALSVLVGDYARRHLGLDRYKPRPEEIERYIEELKQYNAIQSMQYLPKDDDIALIIKNCPVCIDGEPTEREEVSGHRNLERVETNTVRGGMCLVIAEGIGLKAPKIKKNVDKMKLDGWEWLDTLINGASSSSEEEELPGIHPKDKYMRDMLAGRPPFSYPMRKGGFRLRLGRARNTGLATCGFNPATLHILGDYLAVGTQMKVERPGKACGVTPVTTIEGPTVRLISGEVRRIDTLKEADKYYDEVEYILDVGEILIAYGEFMENNHVLAPPSYCEEWWMLEGGKKHPESEAEAISFVTEGAYLHPEYTWFWDDCTIEQLKFLSDKISETGEMKDGVLFIKEDKDVKAVLEELLVPHKVADGKYLISTPLALIAGLGLTYSLEKNSVWANHPEFTDGLQMAQALSGIKMRSKAGTRVGGRMGRPGKSAPRKMKPPVHVLFPLGKSGGQRRSVESAAKDCSSDSNAESFAGSSFTTGQVEGLVHVETGERKCPNCGAVTFKSKCPECGNHTNAVMRCQRCSYIGAAGEESCPNCGAALTCSRDSIISLKQEYDTALSNCEITDRKNLTELKGVMGLISKERVVEPLEKGILRAKNGIFVFRDGTIRYDMIDLPLTHFKPREVSVSVEKLRSIGYTKDTYGAELTDAEQIIELNPQDIMVSQDCAEYLMRVAKYIDELLVKVYKKEPFYNIEKQEDLVGQLIMGLAPHTSAGVLARLVGFTKAKAGYAHPYYHAAKRRNCDGDEDCVMLLMDGLLNFSRSFLPGTRGGTMDAPLVLTTILNPNEVDKETKNVDVGSSYPLSVYEACLKYDPPKNVSKDVDYVEKRVGKESQFEGFKFTHDTYDISEGPLDTMYTNPILKSTADKIKAELDLADKIRAVDTDNLAERIINSHLMPDMIGNLRSFSKQSFRCPKCKTSSRRMTMSGKCPKCGGQLKATMHKGNVTKYLEVAKFMSDNYKLSDYTVQRIKVVEMNINSTFGEEEKTQMDLSDFF
ncbi:MAG: DNA polymerase II large subunit [Methanocorpusculum sp.]|nr:DNA polymerase II large subunit [Methanocorpusculum sp.]